MKALVSAAIWFATLNRRLTGDRRPYAFVTRDFGQSWRRISAGLPGDQYVHVVRQDPRNPDVLYAGLEQGVWISFDGGAHWQQILP